jgi:hypothetical protein
MIYLIIFITLIFLIREIVEVGEKFKCNKYLGMERVVDNIV